MFLIQKYLFFFLHSNIAFGCNKMNLYSLFQFGFFLIIPFTQGKRPYKFFLLIDVPSMPAMHRVHTERTRHTLSMSTWYLILNYIYNHQIKLKYFSELKIPFISKLFAFKVMIFHYFDILTWTFKIVGTLVSSLAKWKNFWTNL